MRFVCASTLIIRAKKVGNLKRKKLAKKKLTRYRRISHASFRTDFCSQCGQFRQYSPTYLCRCNEACRRVPKVQHLKKEWVLDGESVIYAPHELLTESLEYDFEQERKFDYSKLSEEERLNHLMHFIAGIWQIHPLPRKHSHHSSIHHLLFAQVRIQAQ